MDELPCGYCCAMCDEYDDPDHSCELCTQPLAEPHERCLASVAAYLADVEERRARGEM